MRRPSGDKRATLRDRLPEQSLSRRTSHQGVDRKRSRRLAENCYVRPRIHKLQNAILRLKTVLIAAKIFNIFLDPFQRPDLVLDPKVSEYFSILFEGEEAAKTKSILNRDQDDVSSFDEFIIARIFGWATVDVRPAVNVNHDRHFIRILRCINAKSQLILGANRGFQHS